MSASRYHTVAVALHWAIALAILAQIAGGFYMHNLPNSAPAKFDLYQLHKSFGLSILVLSLLRLGWRLTHPAPPVPTSMPAWQRIAARGVHWLFYALMIATPVVGLVIVSVSPKGFATEWFGLIPVPHFSFLPTSADAEARSIDLHEFLSFAILGLLALHVGAALKHGFVDRDGVLRSMAPGPGAALGVGLIFAFLGAGAALYFAGKPDPASIAPPPPRDAILSNAEDAEDASTDAALSERPPEAEDTPAPAPAEPNPSPPPASADAETPAEPEPVATPAPAQPAPVVIVDAGPCANGAAANWSMTNGSLGFTASENGRAFNGAFNAFTADIAFYPDALAASWIDVRVATQSATSGDDLRDSTMPGEEWFDVDTHPTARFASCEIRAAAEGYEALGTLSIKDIERDIIVPFTVTIEGDTASARGGVDLVRTDFDLGAAASWLDDEGVALEVRVDFSLEAARRP